MRQYINKIFNTDCIEFMEQMPESSIDLVFADYPFNCQDKRKDYIGFIQRTVELFDRICKPDANLFIINNPINCFKTAQFFKECFFLRQSIALIRKGGFYPAWHLGFQHNTAMMFTHTENKKLKWNGSRKNHIKDFGTDVISYQNGYRGKGKKWHPQAIPYSLAEKFINILSDKNDLVFIPFVGSGTECIAAFKNSRKYCGTEYSKKYYDMALDRIVKETVPQRPRLTI